MRADRVPFLAGICLAGVCVISPFSFAQDKPIEPAETVEVSPELDDLKLLVQQSALPYLTGSKPFVLREASWSGEIEPGKARLIQVQLFKRNDYHFWLAVPDRKSSLNLNLYNGKGELVEAKSVRYETSNVTSLVASPEETGLYYLRLSMQSSVEEPQRWAVIYAYR
ncbi:MAG: hypothetical protein KDN18_04830 [Verrucomicrobiae bacterium]|nr:hypothetical protein [Verrucomicrobiae bacterium]